MENEEIKREFEELNDFVYKNGTGIRKEGKGKYSYYNTTVYFTIVAFFYKARNKKVLFYLTKADSYRINSAEKDDIYFDLIDAVAAGYDPEKGSTFISFFRLCFERALMGAQKDDAVYYCDDEKGDPIIDAIDQALLDENGYDGNWDDGADSGVLKEESFELICETLYEIMQVIANEKRTRAEIYRIFYTDRLMKAFYDYRIERKKEFRHEKQIFENMERQLVDYVFAEVVTSLRDMSCTDLKTVKELMEYYSDLEEDKEEVERKYLSVWGIKEKEHPEYKVKLPLSNAVFLAYIFIKEYEQNMRRVIPEPHKPAYFSNYSKKFNELIASFLTPEIKEIYG